MSKLLCLWAIRGKVKCLNLSKAENQLKVSDLPKKCGMASGVLIFVFFICLIILPSGTWLIRSLYNEVLLHRTSQAADQMLSTIPMAVDKAALSKGELKLDLYQTQAYFYMQADRILPDAIKKHVSLEGVNVEPKQGHASSMHWLDQEKDRYYYQITCIFLVTGYGERQYEVKRSVYLMLD